MFQIPDYGHTAFGEISAEDAKELSKALTAGSDRDPPGSFVPGDGFALRIEDLDPTLKVTTFEEKEIKLFKELPKSKASNTVFEHNEQSSYGQELDGFFAEGGVGAEYDSVYERKIHRVKYMAQQGRVTHIASLVANAHGPAIDRETISRTRALLGQIERGLFYADSSVDPLQFDGYLAQIRTKSPAANTLDLRGGTLNQETLNDIAMRVSVAPNYGNPTHMFLDPLVHADLAKTFFPNGRYEVTGQPNNLMLGSRIAGWTSPAGEVAFVPNKFIQPSEGRTQAGSASAVLTAPAQPSSIAGVAGALGGGETSSFGAADAGNYRYAVVAVSPLGRSAALQDGGSVTVAAGEKVTVTVTHGAGTPVPTYYEIYRTKVGGAAGTAWLIGKVARSGGATSVFTDFNQTLPDTSIAILFEMNPEVVEWKQLLPMMRWPLAITDTSIKWLQIIYGTPTLYAPKKIALIKNIGRAPNSL
jgi:hypothetical protein